MCLSVLTLFNVQDSSALLHSVFRTLWNGHSKEYLRPLNQIDEFIFTQESSKFSYCDRLKLDHQEHGLQLTPKWMQPCTVRILHPLGQIQARPGLDQFSRIYCISFGGFITLFSYQEVPHSWEIIDALGISISMPFPQFQTITLKWKETELSVICRWRARNNNKKNSRSITVWEIRGVATVIRMLCENYWSETCMWVRKWEMPCTRRQNTVFFSAQFSDVVSMKTISNWPRVKDSDSRGPTALMSSYLYI